MSEIRSFDPIWDTIYSEGRHILKYPSDFVVTFVNRYAPKNKTRKETMILEIGCGTANNLWFAAREGFSVTGIDASSPAIEHARKRFKEDGLLASLHIGDFTQLPFESESFDLAFERGALVCTGISAGRKAINEVWRVLKPGGRFLLNPYSDRLTLYEFIKDGPDGTLITPNVGQICLYNRQQLNNAISGKWKTLKLEHVEAVDYADPRLPTLAEWRVIVEKFL